LKTALLVVTGFFAAILLGLLPLNLFFAKSFVSELLEESTGLQLQLDGPLRLRLGFAPQLEVVNLTVRNEPYLIASAENLQIQPRLLELLNGRISIKRASLSELSADVCAPRPKTDPKPGDESTPPTIAVDVLRLNNAVLNCGGDDLVTLDAITVNAASNEGLQGEATGHYNGLSFQANLTADNLNQLLQQQASDQLILDASAGNNELSFSGKVDFGAQKPALNGQVSLSVSDMSMLTAAAGLAPKPLPGFSLQGDISVAPDRLALDAGRGVIDGIPVSIRHLSVRLPKQEYDRLQFSAEIQAGVVDAGALGSSAGQNEKPASPIEPDSLIDALMEALQLADGQATVVIDEFRTEQVTARQTELQITLKDGSASASVRTDLAEAGALVSEFSVDSTASCAAFNGSATLSNTDIDALLSIASAFATLPEGTSATLSGTARTVFANAESCGRSVDQLLAGLTLNVQSDGNIVVTTPQTEPLAISRLDATLPSKSPLRLTANVRYGELPLEVRAQTGASLQKPLSGPVDVVIQSGNTTLAAAGRIDNPQQAELRVTATSDDISALSALTGLNPDAAASLDAQTDITIKDSQISLTGLRLQLGNTELRGSLSSKLQWQSSGRDYPIVIDLVATNVDLAELVNLSPDLPEEAIAAAETQEVRIKPADISLPAGQLSLQIGRITGLPLPLGDIKITGKVYGRTVENATVEAVLDETLFTGQLDSSLEPGDLRILLGLNAGAMNIGRMASDLGLVENLDASAEGMSLNISSTASDLRELIVTSDFSAELRQFRTVLEGELTEIPLNVIFPRLVIEAPTGQPALWSADGNINDVDIEFRLKMPFRRALEDDELPLRLLLKADEDAVALDMTIDRSNPDSLKGTMLLSSDNLPDSGIDIEDLNPPLNHFQLEADFEQRTDKFSIKNIDIRMPDSAATGSSELRILGDRREFDLNLHATALEVRDFAGLFANSVEDQLTDEAAAKLPEPSVEEDIEDLGEATEELVSTFLDRNWFTLKLEADDIRSDGKPLGGGKLHVSSDDVATKINPLRITSAEGAIEARAVSRVNKSGESLQLDVSAENFDFGALLPLIFPESPASGGRLYIDTSLSTTDPVRNAPVSSGLAGEVVLGIVPENMAADVLDLWAGNLLFAMLPAPESANSRKRFNCVVARFDVESGIMKTSSLLLDSTDIIIRGRGEINIPDRTLDIVTVPQAKREKFLSMSTPVRISGPWGDFNVGVEGAGFIGVMFRWWMALIYVPYKWLTGENFPADGLETCYKAMGWDPADPRLNTSN